MVGRNFDHKERFKEGESGFVLGLAIDQKFICQNFGHVGNF